MVTLCRPHCSVPVITVSGKHFNVYIVCFLFFGLLELPIAVQETTPNLVAYNNSNLLFLKIPASSLVQLGSSASQVLGDRCVWLVLGQAGRSKESFLPCWCLRDSACASLPGLFGFPHGGVVQGSRTSTGSWLPSKRKQKLPVLLTQLESGSVSLPLYSVG